MLKIISFVDWDIGFVFSTLGWSIEGLKNYLNCEVKLYSYNELRQRTFDSDTDNLVLIFEAGMPGHSNWTIKQLREKYINCKIVALASDTCYYMANNLEGQLDYSDIDLTLELMPNCFDWLKNKGANVDLWKWTISERLYNYAQSFKSVYNRSRYNLNYEIKEHDFIGVYNPGSIENPECWRHHAVKYIKDNKMTFTQGAENTGHSDTNFERLFENYLKSKFCLGTTSHNRAELTKLGCMKGFRDWIAPVLDCLLIYDDHPNIMSVFNQDNIIPTYKYDDLTTLSKVYEEYWLNEKYFDLLGRQKEWTINNTIERQLVELMLKHKILKLEDFRV